MEVKIHPKQQIETVMRRLFTEQHSKEQTDIHGLAYTRCLDKAELMLTLRLS